MAYCDSPSRRLFSAASFVGVPKIVSNAVMREQRSWIFFLTATASCGRFRQEHILSQRS